mmetsp:Transcript_28896/g.70435  ORF Transcript_28896/g.70435 Transcript_28896/m.70435 type:complete len:87 (+) Transcript_28896:313-573(+)
MLLGSRCTSTVVIEKYSKYPISCSFVCVNIMIKTLLMFSINPAEAQSWADSWKPDRFTPGLRFDLRRDDWFHLHADWFHLHDDSFL